jgi:putative salt-induced outer membrane protein YdiY
MLLRALLLFTLLFSLGSAFAEQIILTNGDRITGSVVKADDKTLVLKTEFAGTIEIKWSAIKELISDKPLFVTTAKSPEPYSGTITQKDDSVEVTSPGGKTVSVPKSEITALRSPAEQESYEKSLHPPLLRGWNGGLNLGYALTAGNSQTSNLAVAFFADRPTLTDKISLDAKSVYAKNNAQNAVPSTTANSIQAGLRYDRNLTPKLFAFVNANFQTDELQQLDLRSIYGGGLGFHAMNGERTTLDLLVGANYTREDYSSFTRNIAALTLGEELMHKFGTSTVIKQKFFIFPDLSNLGDYRMAFDLGTVTKLNKWLGWQNSFGDIYVTNPPLGTKKNDIIFTTGLNVSFNH